MYKCNQNIAEILSFCRNMGYRIIQSARLFERSETGSRGDPHEVWGDFLNPSVARTRDVVPIRHVCAVL